MIGQNISKEGTGEPVESFRKPKVPQQPITTLPDSDEFNSAHLGPQWQWEANPQPDFAFPSQAMGALRLINEPEPAGDLNLWNVPNLLLQKFPALDFTVTTKLTFTSRFRGEETGLIVLGQSYAYIGVKNAGDHLEVRLVERHDAEHGGKQTESSSIPISSNIVYLQAHVAPGALVTYGFSADGITFKPVGSPFHATAGRWVGARIGLFATSPATSGELGYADYDWFRFTK